MYMYLNVHHHIYMINFSLLPQLVSRERKLDSALLQSGKFSEALDSLLAWLRDAEELVRGNVRPLTADYKLLKTQAQEQKFLRKMLDDRASSVDSLRNLAADVTSQADDDEREQVTSQVDALTSRWQALSEFADQRQQDIDDMLPVSAVLSLVLSSCAFNAFKFY